MKTIKKSIEISAPKESVWAVLLEDAYSRDWMSFFMPGTRAKTDWIEGHKIAFVDNSNNGIVGKITEKKPYERLVFTYDGMIYNGVEDFESENSKAMKGVTESYRLSSKEGATLLEIESGMDDDNFEEMSKAWESALQRISELSHAI